MTERTSRPWLNYLLAALCVGAIVAAVLVVGPSAGGQAATRRTAKAVEGVVQSTVSGSGNLQPASQLNLGFKTGGTITRIYVTQGEHVSEGHLLAELDPSSAEVTLEQSRASLQAAEAKLAKEEETNGEGSGSGGSDSATPSAPAASLGNKTQTTTAQNTSPTTGETTSPKTTRKSSQSENSSSESEGATAAKATVSTATREANLASARAAVKSDALTVRTDEEALASTKLYAPASGTIVSLAGQVGEVVSASGTTRASSSASSSASSGSSASGSSARSATGSSGTSASSSDSGTGSSSSSAFAVLADLSSMQLVAPLSESEVGEVKAGQIATVTVEALEGRKLAAHVSEVATLSTSSSGVVSYDVTFQLDQMDGGVKPGMSATAEVVVKQAEGVNVPSSAITGGSVTVVSGGKDVRRRVVTGLAGNSSTIVVSGLKAGETVVLPAATSTKSSTSLTSRLGRLAGGGGGGLGGGGGGLGGGGGGGAVFFRGGG